MNGKSTANQFSTRSIQIFSLLGGDKEKQAQGLNLFDGFSSEEQEQMLQFIPLSQRESCTYFSSPEAYPFPNFLAWKLHLLADSNLLRKTPQIAVEVFQNCFDSETLLLMTERCQHIQKILFYFLPEHFIEADTLLEQMKTYPQDLTLNEEMLPLVSEITDLETLNIVGSHNNASYICLDELVSSYQEHEINWLYEQVKNTVIDSRFPNVKSIVIRDSNIIETIEITSPKVRSLELHNISELNTWHCENKLHSLHISNSPFIFWPCDVSELQSIVIEGMTSFTFSHSRIESQSKSFIKSFFEEWHKNYVYLQSQGQQYLCDFDYEFENIIDHFDQYQPILHWESERYMFDKRKFFEVLLGEIQSKNTSSDWFVQLKMEYQCVGGGRCLPDDIWNYLSEDRRSICMSTGEDQMLSMENAVFHSYDKIKPLYGVVEKVVKKYFFEVLLEENRIISSKGKRDDFLFGTSLQGWLASLSEEQVQMLLDEYVKYNS